MPIRIGESQLRGLHEHLSAKHGRVEIVASDMVGLHEDVSIDTMVKGHLWVGVSAIMCRCSDPDLHLTIQDNPSKTVELSWSPEATESAQFVKHMVHKCTAPLQLLCRPGWAVALPFVIWWLLWRLDPFSIYSTPEASVRTPSPAEPGDTPRLGRPEASWWPGSWWPIIVGGVLGIVGPQLPWVRHVVTALADWYHRLYPAVYFDLPWTSQYGNEARWIGVGLYFSVGCLLFWPLLPT